jgi:hypothetical protein
VKVAEEYTPSRPSSSYQNVNMLSNKKYQQLPPHTSIIYHVIYEYLSVIRGQIKQITHQEVKSTCYNHSDSVYINILPNKYKNKAEILYLL